MIAKRCLANFAGLLFLTASALAAIDPNPQIAFTISIPNAGPLVFDGTYLWVASSDLVTAIDPAMGAVVVSQSILGTKFMAYDAPTGTLWLEGGSQNAQLNKVSAQQIIATNGNAAVKSIAFSSSLSTGLALDSSASGRNVWAVADGVATIIAMETLEVVSTISAPGGYPILQINAAPSLGGMLVSGSSLVGDRFVANVWLYGTGGALIQEIPYQQLNLSPGAWDGPMDTQYWGQTGDGVLYKYIFTPMAGSDPVTRSTLYLTDATDSAAPQIGGISGLAVSATDGLVLVARQEIDVPNQVYFVSVLFGRGAHEVPGLTVPGAVLTAFGGGFAWASSSGPDGCVTAMTY